MHSWTVESTANPILAIPLLPHQQYQQQIKLRKERWWMLPNRQTLPLNPHPSVSSRSQMSWSPMRWIVLCPSTNHSWMHSKPFTSIRLAIWPSHVFTSLSIPTLTLKRISSKQRGRAYPRQIMRINCSWSVGRARCIKWLMKCYPTMSVYKYEDIQTHHCHHVCDQPLVDCFLNNPSPVIYINAFINRSAVK